MSTFNEKSLSLLIGTMTGDAVATLDLLKANLIYAIESRMLHGRDTAWTNGKATALTQSTQKITASNRHQVAVAVALKAGFYAVPVLANFAKDFANKDKKQATADKVTSLTTSYITLFVEAYESALPVPKAVVTEEAKAEVKAAKEIEVQKAAIAYAKDMGMVHEKDIPAAPTLQEYMDSATDAQLTDIIHYATKLLEERKAAVKADAAIVTERQTAAANAAAANAAQLIINKRESAVEIDANIATLAGIKENSKRSASSTTSTI